MATYAQPAVIVLRIVHIGIASIKDATRANELSSSTIVHFISFIMFNKLFNNIVVRHGHSDCADYIIANVADGVARVAYKNGNVYEYTNVSRRALLNLVLNDNISLGRWINDCLLFVDSKCAKFGTASLVNLAY